jgi:hypothetical protein
MFVDASVGKSTLSFRMGFKSKAFHGILWSQPITLRVIP